MTARIFVRYRRPVPINTELLAARAASTPRTAAGSTRARDRPTATSSLAEARGAFLHVPLEHFLRRPRAAPRATAGRVRTFHLERTQIVAAPIDEAWTFYADPGNLEAITPPWLGFRIDSAPAALERGAFLRYRLRLFGVPIRWTTVIARWHPPRSFVDVQLERAVPPVGAHPPAQLPFRAARRSTTTSATACPAAYSRRSSNVSSPGCSRRSSTTGAERTAALLA